MIKRVIAYGDPALRAKTRDLSPDYPELKTLISDMYETMYNASGVGLAAPQVGLPIRLFITDTTPIAEDDKLSPEEKSRMRGFKKVFINPKIEEETGEEWNYNEGCLSIPDIREDVERKAQIRISYLDENFQPHTEAYNGIAARVIQHEYDHLEGVLFTDKLSPLKKRLLKRKLVNISKGKIAADYPMKFPDGKGKK